MSTNTFWAIEGDQFRRVPGNRLSAEDSKAIAERIRRKFAPVAMPILCNQCFQREVVEEGKKCLPCVRILAARIEAADERNERRGNLAILLMIFAVALVCAVLLNYCNAPNAHARVATATVKKR